MRDLSRRELLQRQATASGGAVLVSFWRVPGMAADSGTPVDWLLVPSHRLVHVRCVCPPEVAASRFGQRRRHPGHLDDDSSGDERLESIRHGARLPPLELGDRVDRIDVDTSQPLTVEDVDRVAREIRYATSGGQ